MRLTITHKSVVQLSPEGGTFPAVAVRPRNVVQESTSPEGDTAVSGEAALVLCRPLGLMAKFDSDQAADAAGNGCVALRAMNLWAIARRLSFAPLIGDGT